ncbi:hypothetical protein ZEAMMB73_Zm00001d025850 [Zea mays]|uniref:Uncharacterized protein n=1 Tax=Zea mays TaxID=4577 RepID=A0A1D6JAC1_MAIZE|nr:hypothetical protein ZEAMMB73_Zm00001d025850 [Zea mays]
MFRRSRSAEELYEADVQIRRSATSSFLDIRFHRGTLYLLPITVDDTTEYVLLNLMAFERLHVGAGNDVTAYVFFMDNMVDSARDVALLQCIIWYTLMLFMFEYRVVRLLIVLFFLV